MDKHPSESTESSAQNTAGTFVPPRHWIGPEELEASYWQDPAVKEKRGQEFFEKPVELIAKIDQADTAGIARRDFLTIMGASMALASTACARRPVHKIIPYVVKPEEITPGVSNFYATTCGECSTGCGVVAKNREGRPIKLEGNTDHPLNKGALCSRGQASILNLYDPDRLRAPLLRNRPGTASGPVPGKESTWLDVDGAIVGKLKAAAGGAGRVRVLSGAVNSESTRRLIGEFLSAFRAGEHVEWEPTAHDDIVEGQAASYGTGVLPRYRFDQAKMVVSLGADFLGTWISPVEHARDWHSTRKLNAAAGAKQDFSRLVVFEPTFTITGGSADERVAVRPGDELKIALAIANELVIVQKRSGLGSDASVASVLSGYKAETVAQETGVDVALIRKVANELWENRGKSLVVGGGIASQTAQSLSLQVAVNLLNSVLENDGVTVDGTASATNYRAGFAALNKLIGEMKSGLVDVLIVYRTNPAYALPKSAGFAEAVAKVGTVIQISDREDETGLLADFVLPDHHYLENWGDASPRKGVYSLMQPTIAPLYSTRAFQDSLISWIKAAGLNAGALARGSVDWHAFLMSNWRETVYRQSGSLGSFEQFWEGTLRAGVLTVGGNTRGSARSFRAGALGQVPRYAAQPSADGKFTLALYSKVSMGDGRSANNAWIQEMPDPISAITWDNYLNVAPSTAKKLGLKEDDVVEVKADDGGTVQLPVHVQPGMHPSVVSAAIGYGRRAVGKVGNGAGIDVYPLVRVEGSRLAFSGQAVSLRKTMRMYRLASTQWHTATENRPVINDITITDFVKSPAAANHTDPELRMHTVPSIWPQHEYKGHRWGMAIDLTSCIGCGACVLGCQAENNVPVVGREQVRNSRNMHWIRIDRYYAGTAEKPDVVFQPMLCQHCENAPCETVCPVLATVHDDEGLNVQVYNRCVGTRYCQNNCPYKVRRFNFFDHWKSYEGPMNMVWNPEVTVRSRGIMEKCTFCVQRIRDGKDKAKDAGERVADGMIKTACQQTCPTDAIVFGDLNDPNSRVSKLRDDPRSFRVLETLNTKPVVNYMSRVRNREGHAHNVPEGGHGAPANSSNGEHHG